VTRSGAYSVDYEAWKAFDGDNASMWISATFQTPAWIAYNFGFLQRVTQYAITFSNGSLTTRAPKDWTLLGWNGSAWINIDTRSGEINWAGFERRQYSIAAPGNYSQYRLNIIDDNDSTHGRRRHLHRPVGAHHLQLSSGSGAVARQGARGF
jgi:hypothetical protein